MDVSSLQAIAGYAAPKAPSPAAGAAEAAEAFLATMRGAEAQGAAAVTGGGDPHALVTALTESRLALEATVAVRDRVVEAYQELLRMPV
ncbi:flagellar hook-basal body complex protein FliE [Jannaschia sp. W003]|uniref:flagellar hook-basal body complex protein FliE n=1 Tax=Jannaschia sp. W003 TaxID=2867012 RepID=UPI0021A58FFF|nr:flagellar hook-basal body complex protein FliE [Jannaschia sp. W003]UWQ21835.1 flagellar hook-basal body complex protein FliE [Jannaschia sp. W003]